MRFLKVLTILFFYSISVSAQVEYDMRLAAQSISAITNGGSNITGSWIPPKPKNNNYIKGSQYLFDSWAGQYIIVSNNGAKSQILNLNYNITSKKIESYIGKDSVFQFDLDQFDFILKFDKKYKVYKNHQLEGLFLELYNEKNIILYKETLITIQEGVMNPLTQELISEGKYVKKAIYYLYNNGKYDKIKLGKSSILKSLNDKEKLIKAFVSENKLSYTGEKDVVKILTYYNSI